LHVVSPHSVQSSLDALPLSLPSLDVSSTAIQPQLPVQGVGGGKLPESDSDPRPEESSDGWISEPLGSLPESLTESPLDEPPLEETALDEPPLDEASLDEPSLDGPLDESLLD